MCILISVLCSESVLRWLEELLRGSLGRVEEDMSCGVMRCGRAWLSLLYTLWSGGPRYYVRRFVQQLTRAPNRQREAYTRTEGPHAGVVSRDTEEEV
jgi:hypothetical protein